MTISSSATEIVAVYRWSSGVRLVLALVGLVVGAAAYKILPGVVGGPIALICVAMATYIALVTFANRTTVRANREVLQVRHGPVPVVFADAMDPFGFWPDVRDAWIPTASLLAIAAGEREVMNLSNRHRSPTKVFLRALYHDGTDQAEIQLLPSSAPPAVETFIGWHLGRWLQDADLPHYKGVDLTSSSDSPTPA